MWASRKCGAWPSSSVGTTGPVPRCPWVLLGACSGCTGEVATRRGGGDAVTHPQGLAISNPSDSGLRVAPGARAPPCPPRPPYLPPLAPGTPVRGAVPCWSRSPALWGAKGGWADGAGLAGRHLTMVPPGVLRPSTWRWPLLSQTGSSIWLAGWAWHSCTGLALGTVCPGGDAAAATAAPRVGWGQAGAKHHPGHPLERPCWAPQH